MNANDAPRNAVTDAELIRYLDGELDADESQRVEAAIAKDDTVAGRLATLRRRDANLSALLRDADPSVEATRAADPLRRAEASSSSRGSISRGAAEGPSVYSIEIARETRAHRVTPANESGRPWLRAAVIVFALLAAGMLVPPVRAWIVDRLDSLGAGDEPAVEMSPAIPPTGETAPVAYGITVTGGMLEIALDASQAAGDLTVRVDAEARDATLEPAGADAGDPVLVTPGVVRIQNADGSAGSYALTLPPSVTTLLVRIGGEARTYDIPQAEPLTIPLNGTGA